MLLFNVFCIPPEASAILFSLRCRLLKLEV